MGSTRFVTNDDIIIFLDYDLSEMDPLRYNPKWCTTEYSLIKCQESYGMNNAIGYPHEERHGGRPTYRVSGIHDELLKAGAFMGFHAGWEQPDWYSIDGQKPEYKPSFYRYVLRHNNYLCTLIG